LPTNGGTVYVRLWSLFNGAWRWTDYTYSAYMFVPAGILSPSPGATLGGSSATFTWTSGTGVDVIWLDVGTTLGGTQIYSAGQGSALSRTCTGLPIAGTTVYVRLWSLMNGAWSYTDYTYTAVTVTPVPAGMLSPWPGSTLSGSTVTFSWTGGTRVAVIWLDVGTTPGGTQIYSAAQSGVSAAVSAVPTNGSTLYVRLWSLADGTWRYTDYTYKTGP
jgi:hypothetical protein